MTEEKKKYAARMSYYKCPVCGYSVTISHRWERAGVPRCLNDELQANDKTCSNRAKPLVKSK